MIYFKKEFIDEGAKLLKTSCELGELSKDANELLKAISNSINQYNYQDALALNKKMRDKYLEIEPFELLANRLSTNARNINTNFFECIRDLLKFDYNTICGKALLKAKKISDLIQILL